MTEKKRLVIDLHPDFKINLIFDTRLGAGSLVSIAEYLGTS